MSSYSKSVFNPNRLFLVNRAAVGSAGFQHEEEEELSCLLVSGELVCLLNKAHLPVLPVREADL